MKKMLLPLALLLACKENTPPPAATPEPQAKVYQALERAEVNTLAAALHLPLFWVTDANQNQALDPEELAALTGTGVDERWVEDGAFTPAFERAYRALLAEKGGIKIALELAPEEKERRELVQKELSQGRPTIVQNDFSQASAEDRAIVEHVLKATALVETIYEKQVGAHGMAAQLPADHAASRALFYRNQGPWCVAPSTEAEARCSALPTFPKKISGLYPADLQADPKFCEALAKRKDGEQLLHQFFVVTGSGDALKAVPYSEHYATEMQAISQELKAAAAAITSESEAAFKAYLLAAAQSFLDNNWEPADEAWAKMNVRNSKWYLRIGPDEVYFEPCSRKAGFHVSFARINTDSLEWQDKLDPVKTEMEQALANLAGKPYVARKVTFHLPDFIDIVINAGDSRDPHGATIGQSLPNWGPVANEGRGRTVAMTNLYTDDDSKNQLKAQAESVFCKDAMAVYVTDPKPQVMSTVLHEAAHNLGPAHEYQVKGKTASQIFGGPLASTMEELKAQTAALYFTDWLAAKNLISKEMADRAHVRDLAWGFGHISRGMYAGDGQAKPYSQLAAVQLGYLKKEGAVEWKDELAANGKDQGCLSVHLEKFPAVAEKLMGVVAGIKGRGDLAGAKALQAEFVDGEAAKPLLETIKERWLRAPKASFVYSVKLK